MVLTNMSVRGPHKGKYVTKTIKEVKLHKIKYTKQKREMEEVIRMYLVLSSLSWNNNLDNFGEAY